MIFTMIVPYGRDARCGSNPDFLLGAARPFPRSETLVREGSPLVKRRNSA